MIKKLLLIILLVFSFVLIGCNEDSSKISELEKQITEITNANKELANKISELESIKEDLENKLSESEDENEELKKQIAEIEAQLKALKNPLLAEVESALEEIFLEIENNIEKGKVTFPKTIDNMEIVWEISDESVISKNGTVNNVKSTKEVVICASVSVNGEVVSKEKTFTIEKRNILLGAVGPIVGMVSIYGDSVKKGIELAIEEINAAGGVDVNGTKYPLKLADFINDDADASKAAAAFDTLINKNVDVVLGAVTSGATEGLIGEAKKYDIPVITPTGTADKLTVGEDRDNIFRACFYDSYQGEYMAKYAKEKGYTKAYVLYNEKDAYCVELKDAFASTAEANGMTVETSSYDNKTMDYGPYWETIKAKGYTCVYVPEYYAEVYNIIKAASNAGYEGVIYGGDSWDGVLTQVSEDFDEDFLEKCFYTNHYFGGSESKRIVDFIANYNTKYGTTPFSFAALGYDAVYIIKQAIEAADSLESKDIINALNSITFTNLVTSKEDFKFINGNPQKDLFIITFKDGKEVETE